MSLRAGFTTAIRGKKWLRRHRHSCQTALQHFLKPLSRAARTSVYLRFVVADIDEDSERALGVLHAVGLSVTQEGSMRTKKISTILFVGGSMTI